MHMNHPRVYSNLMSSFEETFIWLHVVRKHRLYDGVYFEKMRSLFCFCLVRNKVEHVVTISTMARNRKTLCTITNIIYFWHWMWNGFKRYMCIKSYTSSFKSFVRVILFSVENNCSTCCLRVILRSFY